MVYRYQEWKDGLHNFDNHIFLTLELCLFLRENVTVSINLFSFRLLDYGLYGTLHHFYVFLFLSFYC